MCVVEREIYVQPTGARKIIETERPCRNATATRLCNNIDHRMVQRSYPSGNTTSTGRERHDDLIITEGRDGTEKVYREVTGRHKRRSSRTGRHSASSSGTPISSENSLSVSSPSRYSTVEVRPAALSPRIRSWDLPQRERTPDRRANERHRSMTLEEKPSYDIPPSLKSHKPATKEGNNSPNGPEQSQRTSSTPNPIPPPKNPLYTAPNPLRSSLRPQIDLKISSPVPSPIISSPGLSNLPSLRHQRNDSAKGFISKESSRGNSSQSDRSSLRRSVAEGQRVRFEEDVYEGRNEKDGGSRSWSESSAEHGERFWGRGGGVLGERREDLRMRDGHTEFYKKAPAAGPDGDRGSSADEGGDLIERRDRHRRRAEDALNGRVRDTGEQAAGSEPRKMARDRRAAGIRKSEERAEQDCETFRSALRTTGRSPILSSSTSRSSVSPPATSRQIRRVTIHQYRYGENT